MSKTKSKKKSTNFRYEEEIIDPILNYIKDNQEFLTQPENLPILAKLGYMYNTLWHIGRSMWGYDGKMWKIYKKVELDESEMDDPYDDSFRYFYSCEDNPKYKIEMCEPIDDKIDNCIYDAWGMHVSNDLGMITYKEFANLIYNGKELTDIEKKELKKNKTFDEWVEILTDPEYRYNSIYPDRKSVVNHVLCTTGNGYKMNTEGYVYYTTSGADQDPSDYGDWENVVFEGGVKGMVDTIINNPMLEETMGHYYQYAKKLKEKEEKREYQRDKFYYDTLKKAGLYDDSEGKLRWDILHKRVNEYLKSVGIKVFDDDDDKYSKYYPISRSSIIHPICNPESQKRNGIKSVHQSYVDAAIKACKEIVEHEIEEEESNVEFAKKSLLRFGYTEYEKDVPKEIDKYLIENRLRSLFANLGLKESHISNIRKEEDSFYYIDFRDTAKNKYGDNNFYFTMSYKNNGREFGLPRTIYNSPYILGNTDLSSTYKDLLESIENINGVLKVLFYYSNADYSYNQKDRAEIRIEIIINPDSVSYKEEQIESEKNFTSKGFLVNSNTITLKVGDYRLVSSKSEPLGKTHPHNHDGKQYFSQAKYMHIYKDGKKIGDFRIDERGFNVISSDNKDDFTKMIIDLFNEMKASDDNYGTYDSINNRNTSDEGSRKLYIHDFMLYLQSKLK